MTKFQNLTGKTFTRLTVIRRGENTNNGHVKWECQCSCGNKVNVEARSLKTKNTMSCGCLKKELDKTKTYKHGMTGTPEYKVWDAMKGRCLCLTNKRFKDYGGRDITVCAKWEKSFVNFYKDVGPRPKNHTLERIDNNKGYYPENVKWATQKEQANNTRQNHLINLHGWIMSIAQWATFSGVRQGTIRNRLYPGWPAEKAIFKPIDKSKNHKYKSPI